MRWYRSEHAPRLLSALTATGLGGLTVVLAAVSAAFSFADHSFSSSSDGSLLVLIVVFIAVGVVVARRYPANPIGWLLIVVALFERLYVLAAAYVAFNYWLGHPVARWSLAALWFKSAFFDLGVIVGLPALLLFPDGKLSSRGWRLT